MPEPTDARPAGIAGSIRRTAWRLRPVLLFAALAALPYLLSYSQQEIAVLLVINVLLVSSYRLLTLTGEWSLGHVVIIGVGACASALLAKRLGVPAPLSMLLGGGAAAATAAILSVPLFRMKGFYFLIGSLAAGEIVRLIWKRFTDPFGGPKGLKRIDPFPDIEAGFLSIDFYEPVNYYFLALAAVSASLFVLYRIERSRIGLTFHAIHWQDRLAESVGREHVPLPHPRLRHCFLFRRNRRRPVRPLCRCGEADPSQRRSDGLCPCLGSRRRHRDLPRPDPRRCHAHRHQRDRLAVLGLDTARPPIYGSIPILSVLYLPNGLESFGPRLRARCWRGEPAAAGREPA